MDDAQQWHNRWTDGRINFHEAGGNALFHDHMAALGPPGGRVFVPLCGKSEDMAALLERGYQVVGIELSPIAIDDLFKTFGKTPEITKHGALEKRSLPGLDVFVGDFFDLTPDVLGPITAVYDRAALVALPDDLRARYAKVLAGLGAKQLLITLEYHDPSLSGPPFSLGPDQVQALYPNASLQERRRLAEGLRGVAEVDELVWAIEGTAQ